MIIKGILMALFRMNPSKDGIWDYLGKRTEAKSRIELERVRNKGTLEAIQSLMPGMVLREGGSSWAREIHAPGAAPSVLFTTSVPALPIAPGELGPASQQAQGPADES